MVGMARVPLGLQVRFEALERAVLVPRIIGRLPPEPIPRLDQLPILRRRARMLLEKGVPKSIRGVFPACRSKRSVHTSLEFTLALMAIRLGCSTITWPRDSNVPEEEMLREISEVGYAGVPAPFRAGERPESVAERLRKFGLRPLAGYLGAAFHEPAERANNLEKLRQHIDWSKALGLTELFVAENLFDERVAAAGHETASRSDQLSESGYHYLADTLNEVGRICRDQGIRACFHNHTASYIETRDEFDRLLALTDPDLVFIGLDTGHLAYASGDVPDFIATYGQRIKILHLKDVYTKVLADTRRNRWDYRTAQAHGIWAELGEGTIDFRAVFAQLDHVGFDGWVIVEIDRTTRPTPRDSISACYAHLASLGLVART